MSDNSCGTRASSRRRTSASTRSSPTAPGNALVRAPGRRPARHPDGLRDRHRSTRRTAGRAVAQGAPDHRRGDYVARPGRVGRRDDRPHRPVRPCHAERKFPEVPNEPILRGATCYSIRVPGSSRRGPSTTWSTALSPFVERDAQRSTTSRLPDAQQPREGPAEHRLGLVVAQAEGPGSRRSRPRARPPASPTRRRSARHQRCMDQRAHPLGCQGSRLWTAARRSPGPRRRR